MEGIKPSLQWEQSDDMQKLEMSLGPNLVAANGEENTKFYTEAMKLWAAFRKEAERSLLN